MIWLDGLDLPMYRHFPVHFVEHFRVCMEGFRS
jgi:gentisate 1,2-dioxygenase